MSEARREPRTAARLRLKIKFKSATVEQFIERYSVDVSRGGIFIRTRDPLVVGTQIRFEFQLQDASPLFTGIGTVVWTRDPDPTKTNLPPGMGVRFDSLSPESYPTLDRILAGKVAPATLNSEPRALGRFPTVPQASGREPSLANPWTESSSADALRETTRVKAYSEQDRRASELQDDGASDPFEEPTRISPAIDSLRPSRGSEQPRTTPPPPPSARRTVPTELPAHLPPSFLGPPSQESFDMVKELATDEAIEEVDETTGTHDWMAAPSTTRSTNPFDDSELTSRPTVQRSLHENPLVSGQISVPTASYPAPHQPAPAATPKRPTPPPLSPPGGLPSLRRTTPLPTMPMPTPQPPSLLQRETPPKRPTLPPALPKSPAGQGATVERPMAVPESEPILLTAPRAKESIPRPVGTRPTEPSNEVSTESAPFGELFEAQQSPSQRPFAASPAMAPMTSERRSPRRWPFVLLVAGATGALAVFTLRTILWPEGVLTGLAPRDATTAAQGPDDGAPVRTVAEAPEEIQKVPAGEPAATAGQPGAAAAAGTVALEVRSNPSGADVFVDGKPTGRKTPTSIDLPAKQPRDLKLVLRGYSDGVHHVSPEAGQILEIGLAKVPRLLIVESTPSGLPVELDLHRVGKTPLTLTGEAADLFQVHEVAVARGKDRKTQPVGPDSAWQEQRGAESLVLRFDLEATAAVSSADRRFRVEPKVGVKPGATGPALAPGTTISTPGATGSTPGATVSTPGATGSAPGATGSAPGTSTAPLGAAGPAGSTPSGAGAPRPGEGDTVSGAAGTVTAPLSAPAATPKPVDKGTAAPEKGATPSVERPTTDKVPPTAGEPATKPSAPSARPTTPPKAAVPAGKPAPQGAPPPPSEPKPFPKTSPATTPTTTNPS